MSGSNETPLRPAASLEQQNVSDTESELDGGEYYNYHIRGKHERLNVFNRRPLFILKETWDDTPRPHHSKRHNDYIQVFDDHTKLILEVYPRGHLSTMGCALVERRAPAPTGEAAKGFTEHIIGYILSLVRFVLRDKRFRLCPKVLLDEDIANMSSDDEEDDEDLSVSSSDEEGSYDDVEEKEKYTTIYYPLVRRPATRNREVHSKLLGVLTHGPNGMADLARGIVGEMMRADGIPGVNNCF